jgi:hypothetical protein
MGKSSNHAALSKMLLDSQSRPSYSPSPEAAEVHWMYLHKELSQLTNTTIQTTCIGGNPILEFKKGKSFSLYLDQFFFFFLKDNTKTKVISKVVSFGILLVTIFLSIKGFTLKSENVKMHTK